jgi:hypothetical protein
MGVFAFGECGKNLACSSRQLAASADRRFNFDKGAQLFGGLYNEPVSVVAMCVCNPDRSAVGINPLERFSPQLRTSSSGLLTICGEFAPASKSPSDGLAAKLKQRALFCKARTK